MNKKIVILLVLLTFSVLPAHAVKIQKDDTWTYKDKDNKEYDEIAIDVVQLKWLDTIVSADKIKTNRTYSFDMNEEMNYDNKNISISLYHKSEGLYLTQEGGLPFIPYNTTVNGNVIVNDRTYIFNNESLNWFFVDDPSNALLTTESIQFTIIADTTIENYSLRYYKHFILNSNDGINDKIKNFTLTPLNYGINSFDYQNNSYSFDYYSGDGLILSAEPAMLISYDTEYSMPVYIAQTEPVKIVDGLSLSSSYELIEYFLVRDEIDNIDNSNISESFYNFWIIGLILIPILNKIKILKNI